MTTRCLSCSARFSADSLDEATTIENRHARSRIGHNGFWERP